MDDYRPTDWREVVGQPTDEIRGLLDGRDTPNFLLYGPPGTGKTTTARLIARELQGNVEEMMAFNASDDRGIDVIRDRIIPAKDATTLTGAPMVIFLDEMESMTPDAQHALRQPMEDGTAVFILACNHAEKVIDALWSRCHDYEYEALSDAAIRTRIEQLAREEGYELSEGDYQQLLTDADGDMRSAIQHYTRLTQNGDTDRRTDERINQAVENLTD